MVMVNEKRELEKTGIKHIHISSLGNQKYQSVWRNMQAFTDKRTDGTDDEIWLVEHPPVFTQGQAGKPEHLLDPGKIPVIKSDRGGQVTYHGPGQVIVYPLLNIRRLGMGVRDLVSTIENSVIQLLKEYSIESYAKPDAPGVYVEGKKISSLGLRIRKGCSFHGVAINVDMDLTPYNAINPCGFVGLEMTDIRRCSKGEAITCAEVGYRFAEILSSNLGLMVSVNTDN